MLADELAAVGDELVGAFLLGGLVIPGTGEGDFHGSGGADGTCAQEERGVTGDNFCIGVSAHIADLGLVSGELAGLNHLVELQTCGNAGQVTALIDGSECVMVVVKILGVCTGTGGMAELNLGEFLGGLDHVVLVTEAVGKDDGAAGVSKLGGSVIALLAFGDVGTENELLFAEAQSSAGFLGGVDEVKVIGGVLIVQEDEADLDVGRGRLLSRAAAGAQGKDHCKCQNSSKELFHSLISSSKMFYLSKPLPR